MRWPACRRRVANERRGTWGSRACRCRPTGRRARLRAGSICACTRRRRRHTRPVERPGPRQPIRHDAPQCRIAEPHHDEPHHDEPRHYEPSAPARFVPQLFDLCQHQHGRQLALCATAADLIRPRQIDPEHTTARKRPCRVGRVLRRRRDVAFGRQVAEQQPDLGRGQGQRVALAVEQDEASHPLVESASVRIESSHADRAAHLVEQAKRRRRRGWRSDVAGERRDGVVRPKRRPGWSGAGRSFASAEI